MPSNGSTPQRDPYEGDPASSNANDEVSYNYIEERFESTIEERADGTTYRITYTRNTSTRIERRTRRRSQFRFLLRAAIALFVFAVVIAIGLIAVGPEGVWEEIKDLLPNLVESDS